MLAGQIEAGASAMVRVVSGTDDHFKDVVNFTRITNGRRTSSSLCWPSWNHLDPSARNTTSSSSTLPVQGG